MLAGEQSPISANIAAIRADLAAWSAGKPRPVQNAVANLDGWLAIVADPREPADAGVEILACTARAVETLESALRSAPRYSAET